MVDEGYKRKATGSNNKDGGWMNFEEILSLCIFHNNVKRLESAPRMVALSVPAGFGRLSHGTKSVA